MSDTLAARSDGAVRSPADVYDEQFVPALFRHWGPVLCDAANIACLAPSSSASAVTSSATRPCSTKPPASVPAWILMPAATACRIISPLRACRSRMCLA